MLTCKLRKITALIIGMVMSLLICICNYSSTVSAVNTSLTYSVYNASNGRYVKSYTLSENPIVDNSRTIIGNDDRYIDPTKNGVVKIITSRNNIGSGFIIDAHTIATDAHCVYNNAFDTYHSFCGEYVSKILVFNSNGSVALTISNPSAIHVPDNFASLGGDTNEYDYALITVTQDLSAYIMFDLGVMIDGFENSNKTVYTTGFPVYIHNNILVNDYSEHKMYTSSGHITNNPYNPIRQFCYNCDTSGGNSGGPVYIESTYNNVQYKIVIGINSGEEINGTRNIATRITTDLLHFYKYNSNI